MRGRGPTSRWRGLSPWLATRKGLGAASALIGPNSRPSTTRPAAGDAAAIPNALPDGAPASLGPHRFSQSGNRAFLRSAGGTLRIHQARRGAGAIIVRQKGDGYELVSGERRVRNIMADLTAVRRVRDISDSISS